mmetsp:Transcript_53159/g.64044  ORF Transcript_53159/g.64044 Transcript_53159/m.64044 type:complete len:86 (+) Transcript_53159:389-646(+)
MAVSSNRTAAKTTGLAVDKKKKSMPEGKASHKSLKVKSSAVRVMMTETKATAGPVRLSVRRREKSKFIPRKFCILNWMYNGSMHT